MTRFENQPEDQDPGAMPAPDARDPVSSDIKPADPDQELLTAYLDGELAPEAMQSIETRLAVEQDFRNRLQEMQRTWDLLDKLPLTEPTRNFTKSTIELVVHDATRAIKRQRKNRLSWVLRVAVLLAIPLVMFLASQWVIAYIQNAENRRLIEDLPLIENIDVYRKAESVEFLMALDESGLFDDETLVKELLDEN